MDFQLELQSDVTRVCWLTATNTDVLGGQDIQPTLFGYILVIKAVVCSLVIFFSTLQM